MKKIAVITRDCAGINATLRSLVRTAYHHNLDVTGVLRGYDGLMDNHLISLDKNAVSGIINKGGTILKTARATRFCTKEGQVKALKTIQQNEIDGLIVIGGNGSLTGAHILAREYHIPVIGIPATIDNDVNGVYCSLGADTAVNVALDAVDKIRDTATSLERIFVVEVMGRKSGYIALQVALSGGCEEVILPERKYSVDSIIQSIKDGESTGKASWILIVAEGKAKGQDVANIITKRTGFETRVTVLGHIQRGGRPTATDRILGTLLGSYAVDVLKEGVTDHCVHYNHGMLGTIPLDYAIQQKQLEVESQYELLKLVAGQERLYHSERPDEPIKGRIFN